MDRLDVSQPQTVEPTPISAGHRTGVKRCPFGSCLYMLLYELILCKESSLLFENCTIMYEIKLKSNTYLIYNT